jgi:hypothetical protein
MLMAEEVLLLLVDDRTGRFLVDSTRLDNVLAGAVLVELATIERVGFPPAGAGVKRGRMVVADPTPLGDPVLDGALATVAAGRPAKPEQLIAKVRKRLRATLLERLLAAGATPDGRTAALVSLLVAVKAVPKVVDGDKKAVRARARDIAAGDWAGAAVKKAINAVNAAQASVIIGAGAAAAVVR